MRNRHCEGVVAIGGKWNVLEGSGRVRSRAIRRIHPLRPATILKGDYDPAMLSSLSLQHRGDSMEGVSRPKEDD